MPFEIKKSWQNDSKQNKTITSLNFTFLYPFCIAKILVSVPKHSPCHFFFQPVKQKEKN